MKFWVYSVSSSFYVSSSSCWWRPPCYPQHLPPGVPLRNYREFLLFLRHLCLSRVYLLKKKMNNYVSLTKSQRSCLIRGLVTLLIVKIELLHNSDFTVVNIGNDTLHTCVSVVPHFCT